MSGNCDALSLKEDDVKKILACGSHIGSNQVDFQMEQYMYKRRTDGMRHILKTEVSSSSYGSDVCNLRLMQL